MLEGSADMAATSQFTAAERNVGLQWVVAVVAGWAIGFLLCEALEQVLTTFFVDGLVIGSAMGIAQGLVLRRRIAPLVPWVLASVVGFGIGKFAADAVGPALPSMAATVVSGAVIGLSAGIAQSLVLLNKVSGAWWWVLANVAAWAAGWSLISLADDSDMSIAMVYVIGAAGAALIGVITGISLLALLRHPTPAAAKSE
jgi:hypothetical protein